MGTPTFEVIKSVWGVITESNLASFYCLSIIYFIWFHSLFNVEAELIVFNLTLVSGFMPLSNRACNITRKININDVLFFLCFFYCSIPFTQFFH